VIEGIIIKYLKAKCSKKYMDLREGKQMELYIASVFLYPAIDPEVRVQFQALPDFLSSSGSRTGPIQPREYN
jgi:hypothetical protein